MLTAVVVAPAATSVRVAVSVAEARVATVATLLLLTGSTESTKAVLTALRAEAWVSSERTLLVALWGRKSRRRSCLSADAVSSRFWAARLSQGRRRSASLGLSERLQLISSTGLLHALLLTISLRLSLEARLGTPERLRRATESTAGKLRWLSWGATIITESASESAITRAHG